MKIRFLTFLMLLAGLCAGAQDKAKVPAFKDGEQLSYAVSYKVGLVNTDVAGVTLSTKLVQKGNVSFYRIEGVGAVYPFYNWFFELNDTYVSALDARTLEPLELQTEIREGKYRFSSRYKYDWDQKTATNSWRNHKNPDWRHKSFPIQPGNADGLALFYNLRSIDLALLTPNREELLGIVLEDTVRHIRYKFIKRELRNIEDIGRFHTLKLSCQLATSTGESFKDGSEFFIWISDDRNKIPLYIESPIRVGTIRARITGWENLKYPLDSKIK